MCDHALPDIPLPSGWPDSVRSAVIYVISPAQYAITCARGRADNSINARVRLAAENDRLKQETQLLREELRIKDARMAKIDPRRRPYCPPAERMAILERKAARAWSLAQSEGLRRILVPLCKKAFRQKLQSCVDWFNRHRPHTTLGGRTPDEAYRRIAPANKRPRWEPRTHWSHAARCAGPKAKLCGDPGVRLELAVTHLNGQQHLPIIKLKRVA